MLGGCLEPVQSRAPKPEDADEPLGTAFPHRLAAIEAQALLGADPLTVYSGNGIHGALASKN